MVAGDTLRSVPRFNCDFDMLFSSSNNLKSHSNVRLAVEREVSRRSKELIGLVVRSDRDSFCAAMVDSIISDFSKGEHPMFARRFLTPFRGHFISIAWGILEEGDFIVSDVK